MKTLFKYLKKKTLPSPPELFKLLITLLLFIGARGFPGSSTGKESACNAGDPGSIPGSGRSPWRRERLPTPVFWPGEFHGLWSPGGRKESDTTERLSLHSPLPIALPCRLGSWVITADGFMQMLLVFSLLTYHPIWPFLKQKGNHILYPVSQLDVLLNNKSCLSLSAQTDPLCSFQ